MKILVHDSIQDAIDRLPKKGGTVIVPPGTYEESITLRDGVTIKGFIGERDKVILIGKGGE